MRYFQDTGLLILYSLLSVFFVKADASFVFAFLCSIILVCVCYIGEKKTAALAAASLFLPGVFFLPGLCIFAPLAFYLLLREKLYPPAVVCVILSLYFCRSLPENNILTAMTAFAFLLAYLLQNRTEKYDFLEAEFCHTRDDSRERNLLLTEKNKTLLEKQDSEIYTATLRERNRIAREIHDNVGHVLSRSILMVGAMKTVSHDEALSPLLSNLEDSLNGAMNSIRSSVHDLHDEAVNLEEVIRGLVHDFTFCPIALNYDMSHHIPRDVKYCFISITKEALANTIKHSNAAQVKLTLREHPALYQLCIEDNGSTAKTRSSSSGIGLVNMQDRVTALNGTLQITTDHGFRIFIMIPKSQ